MCDHAPLRLSFWGCISTVLNIRRPHFCRFLRYIFHVYGFARFDDLKAKSLTLILEIGRKFSKIQIWCEALSSGVKYANLEVQRKSMITHLWGWLSVINLNNLQNGAKHSPLAMQIFGFKAILRSRTFDIGFLGVNLNNLQNEEDNSL